MGTHRDGDTMGWGHIDSLHPSAADTMGWGHIDVLPTLSTRQICITLTPKTSTAVACGVLAPLVLVLVVSRFEHPSTPTLICQSDQPRNFALVDLYDHD